MPAVILHRRSKHDTLVVVNRSSGSGDGRCQEEDPELRRLSEIPSFLPIIRCSTNTTGAMTKDPDILEALDHRGLATLAQVLANIMAFFLRKLLATSMDFPSFACQAKSFARLLIGFWDKPFGSRSPSVVENHRNTKQEQPLPSSHQPHGW